MARLFNIAGPCFAEDHYMLPAMARLPEVVHLLEDKAYFVVHAQRQCGKTTAFRNLVDEINDKGDAVALYCPLEVAAAYPDAKTGLPIIYRRLRRQMRDLPGLKGTDFSTREVPSADEIVATGIIDLFNEASERVGKPFYVFLDEIDSLADSSLVTLLRQLRDGCISYQKGREFPASIALIGMRNIRDYKARIRPDSETLGSASPFNVITEALTLRVFTLGEVRALYQQHTDATGQVFEPGVVELAFEYSGGQPYLVNAIAKWCVDKIHGRRYDERITCDDVHEAREKIIRERGTHLDSLMERIKEPRVLPIVQKVMLGEDVEDDEYMDARAYVLDLGLFVSDRGVLRPANPMYAEVMGRYISWGSQLRVMRNVPETPWVKDDGLDMQGLLLAFQQFWRENAQDGSAPFGYHEAYAQIVLQAFLQRVINGSGEIIREMALGKKAMDLGVKFRGATYAVECKLRSLFDKSPEKAYAQIRGYMDTLGVEEGWLVVFDPDLKKPWEEKIGTDERIVNGKPVHILFC